VKHHYVDGVAGLIRTADKGRICSPDQLLDFIEIMEPGDSVVAEFDEILHRMSGQHIETESTPAWFRQWIHGFLHGTSAPDAAALLASRQAGAIKFDEQELHDTTFRARLLCQVATGSDHIFVTRGIRVCLSIYVLLHNMS
jgi:hypothetical protein